LNRPDITLVNLNMLIIRYDDGMERELHVTLGPLYLSAALERAGFSVDFRDYQLEDCEDPFLMESFLNFMKNPAPVIGLSCMANLLPFTVLAAKALKEKYPDRTIVMGGVGPCGVEEKLLERFPFIDVIAYGEGELSAPPLMGALRNGGDLAAVPGILFRRDGRISRTPPPPRIHDLDALFLPDYGKIDYRLYAASNMITSRGCPYLCSFCSVAPVWGRAPQFRSPESIVSEMKLLHERYGVGLFLFQDEFFVNSRERVLAFCGGLKKAGLAGVKWKAFARINLTDPEVLKAMASAGCVEIRYGIESGSDSVLQRAKKGFTIADASRVVSEAVRHFPRVDTFFVWGFPYETDEDFKKTIFQMISFRLIGSRILPSLLCWLPQTDIYREYRDALKFELYPHLLPEYMLTGHEVCSDGRLMVSERHRHFFDFIGEHPDIFTGFFQPDVELKILPKFAMLKKHGFYYSEASHVKETDSCGACSPRVA
jgi:radical SAM superfamily enzyme YgiQ (UPF0313 family)